MDIIGKKSGRFLVITSKASLLQHLEGLNCEAFLFTVDITVLVEDRGVCKMEVMQGMMSIILLFLPDGNRMKILLAPCSEVKEWM